MKAWRQLASWAMVLSLAAVLYGTLLFLITTAKQALLRTYRRELQARHDSCDYRGRTCTWITGGDDRPEQRVPKHQCKVAKD